MSFEIEGPRLRVWVHSLYFYPAHVVVVVVGLRHARSVGGRPVTPHGVATKITNRVRKGLG